MREIRKTHEEMGNIKGKKNKLRNKEHKVYKMQKNGM